MALLGAEGLADVASNCHANTRRLADALAAIEGVERLFSGAIFHEAVLRLDAPVADVLRALAADDVLGGLDLGRDYPELGDALLVCATEMRTDDEIDDYAGRLARIMTERSG
jgi:glycine dehydrogenase subunit 1